MTRLLPRFCFWVLFVSSMVFHASADTGASRFVFCSDGNSRRIAIVTLPHADTPWNVILTVNGRNEPARTSPYVFGAAPAREGFLFAVLPKAGTPPIFVFDDNHAEWSGRIYGPCP